VHHHLGSLPWTEGHVRGLGRVAYRLPAFAPCPRYLGPDVHFDLVRSMLPRAVLRMACGSEIGPLRTFAGMAIAAARLHRSGLSWHRAASSGRSKAAVRILLPFTSIG